MYKLEFEVRDNEVDIQGVVNNARHKYAKEMGFSFSKMAEEKQLWILVETRIEFKKSLRSEDKFYVTCKVAPESRLRFTFEQEIRRIPDDVLIAKSHNICACLDGNNRNRPYIPDNIKQHFHDT